MEDGVQFALNSKYVPDDWCMCPCTGSVRLVNPKKDSTGLFQSECDVCNMTWQQCDTDWFYKAAQMLEDEKEKVKIYEEKKKEKEEKDEAKARKKNDDFPDCGDIDGCTKTSYDAFQWVKRAYDKDSSNWDPATCGGPSPKESVHVFCSSYQLLDQIPSKTKALNYIRNKPDDEVIEGLKDILKIFNTEAPTYPSLAA